MGMISVMVVDDSEADQMLAKMIIEEFDESIEVLQAYDGEEALEILEKRSKQPDVIFLDINMPRMNGHEFLDKYDAWENTTTVVIMLTSSDQVWDKEKSMAHQCVKKYFTKPLETAYLEEIIGDGINEARG